MHMQKELAEAWAAQEVAAKERREYEEALARMHKEEVDIKNDFCHLCVRMCIMHACVLPCIGLQYKNVKTVRGRCWVAQFTPSVSPHVLPEH
jgi:hypothetical protein